jgi:hypothetical protein
MSFDPCNRPLKIQESIGTSIPKMGVHLECESSFPHTLLHSREYEMWLPSSVLACAFANPCLGCETKARVTTPLVSIVPFTRLFYDAHFIFYYQHGQHVKRVTIIESSLSMRHDDLLGSHLFALAHYWTFLETITWAPNCIFPSLANNTTPWGLWMRLFVFFTTFRPN